MPSPGFELSGALGVHEVTQAWRAAEPTLKRGELPEQVDLGQVSRADSSILALLLEWQARARATGRRIRFINPPESLHVLARLSGVQDLLGWEDSEPSAGKTTC